MPATKYWLKVTPGAIVSLNTDPKIKSKITGNNNVKTTDSLCLKNCFNSKPPLKRPILIITLRDFISIHQSSLDISPLSWVLIPVTQESGH